MEHNAFVQRQNTSKKLKANGADFLRRFFLI